MGSDGVFSDRIASPRIGASIIDGLHTYYITTLYRTVCSGGRAVLCWDHIRLWRGVSFGIACLFGCSIICGVMDFRIRRSRREY